MPTDPDRQARFIERIEPHQGTIRKVAALYARDRADREDLFQEIALQLWRSFESFRGEAAFSTFLYRVALNTALLRLRGAARRPRIEAGADVEDVEDVASAREEHGAGDEDVERLYAAIRELRPLDRAIVMLVLEGQSYDEIGAVTGLTTSNVGARLTRCRQRLRERLGAGRAGQERRPCSTTG